METRRPVLWLVAGRLAGLSTMAIPIVLARIFTPADFGAYRQLFLLYATLYLVAQLGMAESLYYFVPRDREHAGRFAANTLVALFAMGAVGVVVLWLFARPIAALLGDSPVARWLPALGLFLLAMLASSVLEIVLVSERRYRAAACSYAISDVVRTGFLVLPALLVGTVAGVLAGAVVFGALRLLATLLVVVRRYGRAARPDWNMARRQLAYALPFAAAVGVDTLYQQLHLYVIANRFDAATFALYSVACFQIPLVGFLVTSVGNVLMVRIGQQPQGEAALRLFAGAAARLALLLFPLVAWLVVSGPDVIVFLFGARYAAAGPLFVLASLLILVAFVPTDAALRAVAETRFLFRLGVLRLAVLAVLLPLLIAAAGMAGALLATLAAASLAKVAAVARVGRRLGARLPRLLPWRVLFRTAVAAAAAAAAALVVVRALPMLSVLARLAASGAIFGCAYVALALRLGLVPELGSLLPIATFRKDRKPCAVSQDF